MKIIANSLPKSGTHLLTRILDLSNIGSNNYHLSASLLRRTHKNPIKNLLKLYKTDKFKNGIWIDLDKKRGMKLKYFNNIFNKISSNTYSQAHLPYSDVMLNFIEKNDIKMIYIIRDPRDVLVSHFHHHKKDENYQGHDLMNSLDTDKERTLLSLNGFKLETEDETASLRNRLYNSIGWFSCHSANVLAMKFEDLVGEQGGGDDELQNECLVKIELFLDLPVGTLQTKKDEIFYRKAATFRKGQINDWKNYFDDHIKEIVKDEIGEYLIELGYEKNTNW